MTTDITELAQSLKAAAEKATPGEWRRASTQFNGITATPFMLGRKEVMIAAASEKRDAEFIALANPANILALVEALEKAQRANAAQDDHINQQQDRIDQLEKGHQEAAKQINSWRRMAKQNIAEREKDIAELDAARQRIADLESRTVTVKLPQRLQPGADGWDDWYVHSDDEGEYLKFDDVLAMLTAAGIKVEAE
ncbi:TPA: ead/Ea22-like family protein [Klebsiella pneumoniae]|uniref:Ead domain protein n=2 Tax=Klebsiella pneumoniae TaxID=573 RepID=A0A484A7C4_KLEPN|nr:ead/Ea22-like family protein [Klebsiella pneumoniae]EIV6531958.1 ead/Ea22-like family protein [Klebsiella pneumoniae]EIW0119012.1 ead/Ea22-like family protein [Klebsiella pneumoniae]EIW8671042.1 ead/Ea22-like family protein [Klebsiella pneumoniae]EIW8684932.1 ead/Ea22-like family protein [Klebsiella pneumoniae]EIW8713026.1 ead/Ea22-like family protein [Klebsiella pneumoniae]